MKNIFLKLFVKNSENNFTQRVLNRYKNNKPMSKKVKYLFVKETSDTINKRFEEAKKN
jgi:hypothetical protein